MKGEWLAHCSGCGAREFVHRWNAHAHAHHCAVGVGHMAGKLKKVAAMLNPECVQVC